MDSGETRCAEQPQKLTLQILYKGKPCTGQAGWSLSPQIHLLYPETQAHQQLCTSGFKLNVSFTRPVICAMPKQALAFIKRSYFTRIPWLVPEGCCAHLVPEELLCLASVQVSAVPPATQHPSPKLLQSAWFPQDASSKVLQSYRFSNLTTTKVNNWTLKTDFCSLTITARLDGALSNLVWLEMSLLTAGGVGLEDRPVQPKHSVILWFYIVQLSHKNTP